MATGAGEGRSRMWERTDVVHLRWWAYGGPLVSLSGLRELIYSLRELLPEVVPSRWDVDEDYRHRLVDEGLDGLVEFIDAHRWDVLLRAKAPARTIDLYAVPPTDKDGELQVTCLAVELDAKVLDGKGAQRLPDAFEQIAALIEPFYAEARVLRGVAKYEGSPLRDHPQVEVYPFDWKGWWGLPVRPPVAALLGHPYRERWPEFGTAEIAGLAVENPRPWHRAMEPLAWPVPSGLCQVFDPHWAELERPDDAAWSVGFQLMTPDVRPAVWPFDEAPARTRDLAFEFAMSSGDGQIRQVALDDPDGEPFEAWERIVDDRSGLLSVWANRTADDDWTWKITLGALEFVRSEPLVNQLWDALHAALMAVPGVSEVVGEDRETLLVAGTPNGHDLIEAATRAVDGMAADLQHLYDHL